MSEFKNKKERMLNYSVMFDAKTWAELRKEAQKRRWSVSCLLREIVEQWRNGGK